MSLVLLLCVLLDLFKVVMVHGMKMTDVGATMVAGQASPHVHIHVHNLLVHAASCACGTQ